MFKRRFKKNRGRLIVYPSVQLLIQAYAFLIGILAILCAKVMDLSSQFTEIELPLLGIVPTATLQWAPVVLLGFVVMWGVVFSNHVAGPLKNIQMRLSDAADGKPIQTIQCRNGDFFPDIVTAANGVLKKLAQGREYPSESSDGYKNEK